MKYVDVKDRRKSEEKSAYLRIWKRGIVIVGSIGLCVSARSIDPAIHDLRLQLRRDEFGNYLFSMYYFGTDVHLYENTDPLTNLILYISSTYVTPVECSLFRGGRCHIGHEDLSQIRQKGKV